MKPSHTCCLLLSSIRVTVISPQVPPPTPPHIPLIPILPSSQSALNLGTNKDSAASLTRGRETRRHAQENILVLSLVEPRISGEKYTTLSPPHTYHEYKLITKCQPITPQITILCFLYKNINALTILAKPHKPSVLLI